MTKDGAFAPYPSRGRCDPLSDNDLNSDPVKAFDRAYQAWAGHDCDGLSGGVFESDGN